MKTNIIHNIKKFGKDSLLEDSLDFFKALGYESDKRITIEDSSPESFLSTFRVNFTEKQEKSALFQDWQEIDFLFQLTNDELAKSDQLTLFENVNDYETNNYQSYIFIALKLSNVLYSKTQLVSITRRLNSIFKQPVIILFNYDNKLSLSVIDRRLNKKDANEDVLEKVTLIKDIDIVKPHRAHIDILSDLHLNNLQVNSFVELHKKFREILDTKELNKSFYTDLSNWYFRALQEVQFPQDSGDEHINETSLIRFISRILFSWFLKEKGLIPDEIFTKRFYQQHIKEDMDSSGYYKAVLQNLFFATLNTEIKDRAFLLPSKANNYNEQYMVFNKYRYKDYLINPDDFLSYYHNIPFLNGGLFDCLDYETEKKRRICIDCFSNNKTFRQRLIFPDDLFFESSNCDFSIIYDDKKKHDVKVKGLYEILNKYKFTIDENTPVDQEIALDPELLGQTLENLLAAYNPETKQTARNQTGSFYTPREIVDYMVDESMIAYLSDFMKDKEVSLRNMDDLDDLLRDTFAYNEKEHPFDEKQVKIIVDAIFSLKVLDPACGSGAYPMGMLLKMVYVLNRIDPENKFWRQKLESEIPSELKSYIKINTDNYSRKLGLIWNCIYGVDIQSIAIQLTKLRFFISLISEEKVDFKDRNNNFGIIPLPNLETKFVCANTLLKIDKPNQMDIWDNLIEDIENELIKNRQNYFTANSRYIKNKLKKENYKLRQELENLLLANNFQATEAKKIADYDPYDVTSVATWYDSEFMFGIGKGFDIVIGNPPYIQIEKMSGKAIQNEYKNQNYKTFEKTGDIYALFYERGMQLLKSNGILCFITSNKWMRAKYGASLRNYFANEVSPIKIIDFGGFKVFQSATVDTNIILLKNTKTKSHYLKACTIKDDYKKGNDISQYFMDNQVILNTLSKDSLIISSQEEMRIKEKIERIGTPLKDWDVNINYGIKTGLNEAFIISGVKKDELIRQDPKSAEIIRPILRGRDIKRYRAEFADRWVILAKYGSHLYLQKEYPAIYNHLYQFKERLQQRGQCRYTSSGKVNSKKDYTGQHHWLELDNNPSDKYLEEFDRQKIVWGNINYSVSFSLIDDVFIINAPANLLTSNTIPLKFLITIMNSSVFNYQFRQLGIDLGNAFEWKKQYVEKILIPRFTSYEVGILCDLYDKYKAQVINQVQFDFKIDLFAFKKVNLSFGEVLLVNPEIKISQETYEHLTIKELVGFSELNYPSLSGN